MNKARVILWSVLSTVLLGALAVAALMFDKKRVIQAEREALAQRLKDKIAALKAGEAEKAAQTQVAVAQVEQETKQEVARDSVDAANDLIASLRDGKGG
jgi:hypothetical protein